MGIVREKNLKNTQRFGENNMEGGSRGGVKEMFFDLCLI